jgi:hypothetical protein
MLSEINASGLIPQAPLHTSSLVVTGWEDEKDDTREDERSYPQSYPREEGQHDLEMRNLESPTRTNTRGAEMTRVESPINSVRRRMSREPQVSHAASEVPEGKKQGRKEVPIGVVEQRVSNLAQGSLCKWLALFRSNTHVIVITVANKHRSGPHDCTIPACPRSDPQGSPGRSFCTSTQPRCVQGRNQTTD